MLALVERLGRAPAGVAVALERPGTGLAQRHILTILASDRAQRRPVHTEKATKTHAGEHVVIRIGRQSTDSPAITKDQGVAPLH